MIPEPMEIRTPQGTLVLTADNCCVCVFPEKMKEYEHVFVFDNSGVKYYIFDPRVVKSARMRGFPLYWRPYPTNNDRQAYRQRTLTQAEVDEFTAQLELGVDWEELT